VPRNVRFPITVVLDSWKLRESRESYVISITDTKASLGYFDFELGAEEFNSKLGI